MLTINKNSIDESHGIVHSFNTLHRANEIFQDEVKRTPEIKEHEKIIHVSALIHDMCDKKYGDEKTGIKNINELLKLEMDTGEIATVNKILSTMSYSKVKKNGFPSMGKYEKAYHIVREADLLEAYDFDRALLYSLYNKNVDIDKAYMESISLFKNRMFKHKKDNLLTLEYSKRESSKLQTKSLMQMKRWKNIIKILK